MSDNFIMFYNFIRRRWINSFFTFDNFFPDFVTFLRHVCKCLIIKGRSRCFG